MKENFGNLNQLKKIGKIKKYPYTVEQIIDPFLKCDDGENMIEVKNRMKQAMQSIIKNNVGNKVVVVSHGAAIKFYLSDWCNFKENKLVYENKEIKIESPSILKMIFNKENLENIEVINYEEN
ncbi:MAG: histidine phosphatase family protein [Clostridia bacterium]|jgi:phosphoglycerate mutase family protein